jgi:hypothetical protein
MDQVCIPIPLPTDGRAVEIQVTVGGVRRLVQYRVERVTWNPHASSDARFETLRRFIAEYEPGWELVQVGAPGRGTVPVTFRHRSATHEAAGGDAPGGEVAGGDGAPAA